MKPSQTKQYQAEASKKYRKMHPEKAMIDKERMKERRPFYFWAATSIRNHRANGCVIKLTIPELEQIASESKECAICGKCLKWNGGKGMLKDLPTVDRINNEDILSKDTIQILCFDCNRTKGYRSMQEFIAYCSLIVSKFS